LFSIEALGRSGLHMPSESALSHFQVLDKAQLMSHSLQKTPQKIWPIILAILVVVILQLPRLALSGVTNLAMTAYIRSLTDNGGSKGTGSPYEQLQSEKLEIIANLWPIRWFGPPNSFIQENLIIHASEQKKYQQATAIIEELPNELRQISEVRDAATLAYLKIAEVSENSESQLEKALKLRPNDLYVNYHLWQYAQSQKIWDVADLHEDRLRYFTLESVDSHNEELLDKSLTVIPELLNAGVWNQTELEGVVAFLVWQHFEKKTIVDLLQRLVDIQPHNASWPFYLGELYERRGDVAYAKLHYQAALALNPDDAITSERLAVLNKVTLAASAEPHLSFSSVTVDQNILAYVAGKISIPVERVTLGENLVVNGHFAGEKNSIPGWELHTYLGRNWNQGLYVAGLDKLNLNVRVRIIALRGGLLEDGTTTYAEYWGELVPVSSAPLVLILEYASEYPAGSTGLIFLGENNVPGGVTLINESLPHTDGQWKRVVYISDNPHGLRSATPLLRSWGSGQLWFRSLEIRSVFVAIDVD
jgi:tetratricopeptide (TPR) repeat protein